MMSINPKLPSGKPPYLGIRYYGTCMDERRHREFFLEHYGKEHQIRIEIFRDHLHLHLICTETLKIQTFKDIRFKRELLKNWFYVKGSREFNFALTILVNDKDVLLQAWNGKQINIVFKIKTIDIFERTDIVPGPW
ncbi:MAG: hypothetical protein K0S26_2532 [Bacteroidota bacterium]|nr:hypothetical protein [Bacteroidota bacterium]